MAVNQERKECFYELQLKGITSLRLGNPPLESSTAWKLVRCGRLSSLCTSAWAGKETWGGQIKGISFGLLGATVPLVHGLVQCSYMIHKPFCERQLASTRNIGESRWEFCREIPWFPPAIHGSDSSCSSRLARGRARNSLPNQSINQSIGSIDYTIHQIPLINLYSIQLHSVTNLSLIN